VDALVGRRVNRLFVPSQVRAEKLWKGRRGGPVEIGDGRDEVVPSVPQEVLRREHATHLAGTLQGPKRLPHKTYN